MTVESAEPINSNYLVVRHFGEDSVCREYAVCWKRFHEFSLVSDIYAYSGLTQQSSREKGGSPRLETGTGASATAATDKGIAEMSAGQSAGGIETATARTGA